MTRLRLLLIPALVPALALATATAAQAPGFSARERAEGAQIDRQLTSEFGGPYDGPQAAYVRAVGQRIAAESGLAARPGDYKVTLLNSSVNNAFAIPGGYVYVSRQLVALMNSEAELAFVMGHEVGHVAARHASKRETRSTFAGIGAALLGAITGSETIAGLAGKGAQLYALGYSRDQEREADSLGARYLLRAGYDPRAGATILAALGAQTSLEARLAGRSDKAPARWLSTHPANAARVDRIAREAAQLVEKAGPARQWSTNRNAFLQRIDGMAYDDDPTQGIVTGRSFRHGALGLAFDAPSGFALQNSPSAVVGTSENRGQFQFAGGGAAGLDLAGYSAAVWKQAGVPAPVLRPTRINGLEAGISQTQVTRGNGGAVDATLAVYRWGPQSYFHLLMIAPAGGAAVFEPLVASVRRLAPAQAATWRGRKLAIATVRPGETPARLAARMAYDDNKLERFNVLNGLPANARLAPGTRVKLIVYR